jgi:hypothetical protein
MSEAPVSQHFTGEWIKPSATHDEIIAARDAIIAEMTATIANLRSELKAAKYNVDAKGKLLDAVMQRLEPTVILMLGPMAADCENCSACDRTDCIVNPKVIIPIAGGLGHA